MAAPGDGLCPCRPRPWPKPSSPGPTPRPDGPTPRPDDPPPRPRRRGPGAGLHIGCCPFGRVVEAVASGERARERRRRQARQRGGRSVQERAVVPGHHVPGGGGKRSLLHLGAAGGELLGPRQASELRGPRCEGRRSGRSLRMVQGGRGGAALRQGRRHCKPADGCVLPRKRASPPGLRVGSGHRPAPSARAEASAAASARLRAAQGALGGARASVQPSDGPGRQTGRAPLRPPRPGARAAFTQLPGSSITSIGR